MKRYDTKQKAIFLRACHRYVDGKRVDIKINDEVVVFGEAKGIYYIETLDGKPYGIGPTVDSEEAEWRLSWVSRSVIEFVWEGSDG